MKGTSELERPWKSQVTCQAFSLKNEAGDFSWQGWSQEQEHEISERLWHLDREGTIHLHVSPGLTCLCSM